MDLNASMAVWQRVLRNPGEAVFVAEMEQPYARWATAVIWLFGAGLVTVLVWLLVFLVLNPMEQSVPMMRDFLQQLGASETAVAETITQMQQTAQASTFLMLCGMLVGIPMLTLAWSGMLWLTAKLLGGRGSLEKQTFLLSTFIAPLTMVGVLLYLFPFLGPLLVMGLGFYNLYLTYFALRAAHSLTPAQAASAVAVPLVGIMVLTCCAATLWASLVITALGAIG